MQDIQNKDYHAIVGASSSILKMLLTKTPAHVYAQYFDPSRKTKEPSAAMQMGTAIHAAILEPMKFEAEYFVLDEGLDKKNSKSLFAAIEAAGQIPLKRADFDVIESIRKMVFSKSTSDKYLSNGHAEKSIIINCDEYGIALKIRPDYCVLPCPEFPNGMILDVKSTEDASPNGFGDSVMKYGYELSAAWYCDVWQRHFKTEDRPLFVWLPVEKSEPYECAFYAAPDFALDYGREQYLSVLPVLAECIKTGVWNGYADGLENLNFKPYQLSKMGVDFDDAEVSFV